MIVDNRKLPTNPLVMTNRMNNNRGVERDLLLLSSGDFDKDAAIVRDHKQHYAKKRAVCGVGSW